MGRVRPARHDVPDRRSASRPGDRQPPPPARGGLHRHRPHHLTGIRTEAEKYAMINEKLARARSELADTGYAVLTGVLAGDEVTALRDEVTRIAAAEAEAGTAWVSNGNQRVFALPNKGDRFVHLAAHPLMLGIAEEILSPHVLLSSITAHIVRPGNVPQGIHADQDYVWTPWHQPLVVNALWVLDEFTEETGGTVV